MTPTKHLGGQPAAGSPSLRDGPGAAVARAQLPRMWELWGQSLAWLQLALSVRHWLLLFLIAETCMALGLALMLTHLYRTVPFPPEAYYVTLQFVPRLERGLLLLGIGGPLLLGAFLGMQRWLLGAVLPAQPQHPRRDPLAIAAVRLVRRAELARAPKVVAVGGGTGLSTLLRGLKELPVQLTAIVTVCDDGGSSGRLRRDLRVLPPGDIRQCLAALAEAEPLVTQLFEHRFAAGDGLAGHSFGNLFIAALTQITGNFEHAVEESGRVLAVRGRILPATLEDCTLCAELNDRVTVRGESRIPEAARGVAQHGSGDVNSHPGGGRRALAETHTITDCATTPAVGVSRVYLDPASPPANPAALRALLEADLIVLGPGSLYTSILPNLLVGDLAWALCQSQAQKLYVCNVATQPGETDGYDVIAHVRALLAHVRERLGPAAGEGHDGRFRPTTHVLVNGNLAPTIPAEWGVTRPTASIQDEAELAGMGIRLVRGDVVQSDRPTRHDPHKLARAVMECYVSWQRSQTVNPWRSRLAVSGLLRTARAWGTTF